MLYFSGILPNWVLTPQKKTSCHIFKMAIFSKKKNLVIAWATKSGKQVKEWNYFPNKKCVSFSSSQSLLSKFSNQNSFSHIRRSSSIRKVQGTVYYIEIRYKCSVNNTKQDSERATQNIFWRAQTILDMGQNSGKSQFCFGTTIRYNNFFSQ